jgi:hypothetical protein
MEKEGEEAILEAEPKNLISRNPTKKVRYEPVLTREKSHLTENFL